jgi:hypothetical protein
VYVFVAESIARSFHGETHLPSFIEKVYKQQRLHSVFDTYPGKKTEMRIWQRDRSRNPGEIFQSDGHRRELFQLVNNIPYGLFSEAQRPSKFRH